MELKPRLFEVAISRIDPPTQNPRFAAEDLEDLVASITEVGILEPIIGVISPGNRVRLVAGLRRLTSAKLAGLKTVPVLLHASLDDRQELAVSLVENLHRKDMSVIESGEAFIKLGKTGMTQKQIGKMVGVSDFTVSNAIAIVTKCVPEVKEAAHRGEITIARALDLSRLPSRMQKALLHQREREVEIERSHPSVTAKSRGTHGKGPAESLLLEAAGAVRRDDIAMAIDITERALETLRKKTERPLHAVG
jgi:ParB family chromosome partitioning protein